MYQCCLELLKLLTDTMLWSTSRVNINQFSPESFPREVILSWKFFGCFEIKLFYLHSEVNHDVELVNNSIVRDNIDVHTSPKSLLSGYF